MTKLSKMYFGLSRVSIAGRCAYSATKAAILGITRALALELAAEGITAGCGGGKFCPGTAVTRDQMAVFLLKAKHGTSYVPPVATGVFTDVLTNYWAAAWIEQLAAEGITGGCNSNPLQYCPSAPVTRDQMAVFLLKAKHGAAYVPPKAAGVFEDVPVTYWAADWIERLAAEGITSGLT